jgi:uncharacterized phiE125 gp8 family phage protein
MFVPGGAYNYLGLSASYGTLNLTDASPAQSFTEPVSLEEAKQFLVLQESVPSDGVDDDMIESSFIPAARDLAEFFQGRDLVRKQLDLALDYFHYAIELRAPLASVDLVRYRDSTGAYTDLTENTDYIVDTSKQPGIVMPAYSKSWPSFTPYPSSAVLIRFSSGYAASHPFWLGPGKRIKLGMLYLIAGWYEGRLPTTFGSVSEIPFAVSACLGFGALQSIR